MKVYGPLMGNPNLAAGDPLLYASNITDGTSIYHVAMYAGDDKMLKAFAAGTPACRIEVLFRESYYRAQRLY